MNKRIKVRNFLSLRDVNVELRSTNALVGPTMSGKSESILDARAGKERLLQRGEEALRENPQNTLGLGLEMWTDRRFACSEFSDFIKSWRFYNLVPALMRESNPPSPEEHLTEHGENLSACLLTLHTNTEEFRRIKQACLDGLPCLDEISVQPVRAKTQLQNA